MKKYHVHIYRVVEKREVDVEAKTEILAKLIALALPTKKTKRVIADCNRIALSFREQ